METINKINICETEGRILEAARIVFLEKGLERTKMQDIADAASISRTALNYYFRKKEILYKRILEQIFYTIVPSVESIIEKKIPIFEKLNEIVDVYDKMFRENRTFPRFVFNELQRNPKMLLDYLKDNKDALNYIDKLKIFLDSELGKYSVKNIAVEHIFTTFFSLLVAPYLLNPVICEYSGIDSPVADKLLDEHKIIVKEIMKNMMNSLNA